MHIGAFVLHILVASVVWANDQDNAVCVDLARAACGSEAIDDGTESLSIAAGSSDEWRKGAQGKFKAILQKPESANLRRALLATSGLSVLPDCENASDHVEGRCLELLASAATDYLRWGDRARAYPATQSGAPVPLDERYYFLQRPEFMAVQKELGQSGQVESGVAKIANQVKAVLLAKIKQKVKDPALAKLMSSRVTALTVQSVDCSNWQEGEVAPLLSPDVRYQVDSRSVKYCRGSFSANTSEFQMAYLLANEMAHAIDPCNISRGPKGSTLTYKSPIEKEAEMEYPVSSLLTCLHQLGVGGEPAGTTRPSTLDTVMSPAWPYVASQKTESTVMCNQDRLSDAAAVWWASEVLPDYVAKYHAALSREQKRAGYTNAFRNRCPSPDFLSLKAGATRDTRDDDRINKLVLAHPVVRAQMGCPNVGPSGRTYCSGEVTAAATEVPTRSDSRAKK